MEAELLLLVGNQEGDDEDEEDDEEGNHHGDHGRHRNRIWGRRVFFQFWRSEVWNFTTGAEHHGLVFRWDT